MPETQQPFLQLQPEKLLATMQYCSWFVRRKGSRRTAERGTSNEQPSSTNPSSTARCRQRRHPNNNMNTQLVLYNPNQLVEKAVVEKAVVRKVSSSSRSPPPPPPSRRPPPPPPSPSDLLGFNVRNGDIRHYYKVLPILIGTGSFGAVRLCLHRQSRSPR